MIFSFLSHFFPSAKQNASFSLYILSKSKTGRRKMYVVYDYRSFSIRSPPLISPLNTGCKTPRVGILRFCYILRSCVTFASSAIASRPKIQLTIVCGEHRRVSSTDRRRLGVGVVHVRAESRRAGRRTESRSVSSAGDGFTAR